MYKSTYKCTQTASTKTSTHTCKLRLERQRNTDIYTQKHTYTKPQYKHTFTVTSK